MPSNGFFVKPLKIRLLAGEQKATEIKSHRDPSSGSLRVSRLAPDLQGRLSSTFRLAPGWIKSVALYEKECLLSFPLASRKLIRNQKVPLWQDD